MVNVRVKVPAPRSETGSNRYHIYYQGQKANCENKTIVIVIATVLGLLFLLCLGSCCWRCIRRRRKGTFVPTNPPMYPPPRRGVPPPPRNPSMTYYPQGMSTYSPPPGDMAYTLGHAPPYAPPYAPPMRQSRAGPDSWVQQPGEEWIRGPDGAFYPPNQMAPAPPPRARTGSNRPYWE